MKLLRFVKEFALLTVGSLLIAIALNMFIANHNLAFGGVSGIAVIIQTLANIPLSRTNLVLNIPLFIFGAKFIGKNFLLKSLFATIAVSLLLSLTVGLQKIPSDNVIAAIFGGIMMGTGVGIVICGGGSTGGTDLVALILRRLFKTPLSLSIMLIDNSIIIAGAILFGINNALYSVILVFGLARSVKFITQNFESFNSVLDKAIKKIHERATNRKDHLSPPIHS